jgi:hypothetical protein
MCVTSGAPVTIVNHQHRLERVLFIEMVPSLLIATAYQITRLINLTETNNIPEAVIAANKVIDTVRNLNHHNVPESRGDLGGGGFF